MNLFEYEGKQMMREYGIPVPESHLITSEDAPAPMAYPFVLKAQVMTGGRGKILGIIFGTMSFTLIDKIITALGMNALLNDTVKGVILLLAVGLQMIQKKSKSE